MLIPQIINLKTRPDRRIRTEQELRDQGLDQWQFWEGEEKVYNAWNAISRSHKKIVRHAKYQKWPEVLIMEDDVRFTDIGAYQYFLSQKPPEFDIYLAGIYSNDTIEDGGIVKKFQGLHCYVVHERFYDKFLSVRETGDIDMLLAHRGLFVVCYPFAAIQHNGFSDHQQKSMNYDAYIAYRELWKRPPIQTSL